MKISAWDVNGIRSDHFISMKLVFADQTFHFTNPTNLFSMNLSLFFRSRIYFGDYVRDRCREDMNNPYYSIPQSQSSTHHHHHQQQSVATSTSDVEQLNNNSNNNSSSSNNNSLVVSPPSSLQLHPSSQTSLTSSSTASATSNQQQQTITPSVLYTVQRVVSTSQLQQLPSNYGNNSNASSLTSIIARNETDCGLPNNNGESCSFSFTFFPCLSFLRY